MDRARLNSGADEGTRTPNQRFTKPSLCRLSYVGSIGNLPKNVAFVKGKRVAEASHLVALTLNSIGLFRTTLYMGKMPMLHVWQISRTGDLTKNRIINFKTP